MFLLDTNVLSELRLVEAGRGSQVVGNWARVQPRESLHLSCITFFEIEKGILRLERRDPVQASALRRWQSQFALPFFEGRIFPVDVRVSAFAASFHVPDPAPFADSLIAATAIIHGLTVVTRNTRDFAFPGVAVLNPWDA